MAIPTSSWEELRRSLCRSGRVRLAASFGDAVPPPVKRVMEGLDSLGHSAHLVGGCVRDLLLGRDPDDWDVATSALPREVLKAFPRTHPTGLEHGTVTVISGELAVEVTTYRTEGEYADFRRPDSVTFADDVTLDLARRDLTFNAMALTPEGRLVDPHGGLKDLTRGLIRAVGDPRKRFREDALRLLRAVRFSAQLGFAIEPETLRALEENSGLLSHIARERVREEVVRILLSPRPEQGFRLLQETGLLRQFWPELEEGVGLEQNPHHAYTVFQHSLKALASVPPDLCLRLAALLHDVAKPRCLTVDEEGQRRFFHHEQVGAGMTRDMLERLRFDRQTIKQTVHLIRHHMALHHYPDMTDAAIRRLLRRVGVENIDDLVALRKADRRASGTKQAPLSRGARRLLSRIEKVLAEDSAFSLKDLAVDGHDVMRVGGLEPGPRVGRILECLLEMVLEDPSLNQRELLEPEIRRLAGAERDGGGTEE